MKTEYPGSFSFLYSQALQKYARFFLWVCFALLSSYSIAQVSTGYTFSRVTTPTHAAMAGGTTLASGTGATMDDALYTNVPIGFAFNFNGLDYTTVGVSTNGFIWFGATNPATTEYAPISSVTAMEGLASGFGGNLIGRQATATLKYTTTGTCPNRVFMVQWFNFKVVGKSSQFDLQITLTEGTNQVELHVYDQPYLVADNYTAQVGIRGSSNADFNNRSVTCTTNWTGSIAGTVNTASCMINGVSCSCFPANTQRFRYICNATAGTNTWTGAINGDWFNAGNWSLGKIPNTYHSIVIPSSLGTYPILTGTASTFCKSLTIGTGASLTTDPAYTGTLTVNGNVANDGFIINGGTNYITLNGTSSSTISGTGDFTQADFSLSGPCANYSQSNTLVIRKLAITASATLNMNNYNLLVLSVFNQVGTINQSTGTLQIEDPAPTLTNATFNEGTGLTYFAIGTTTSPANQLIPSITYYDLKVNTNNGYTATIGNGSTVSCNNFVIQNPAASGGIASVANAIIVNKNFDLSPTGNTPTVNLNANITVSGLGTTTLYLGVINTGANRLIITNSASTAVVAGAGNTNYTLSYINGNLRRYIAPAAGGNYDFPLGDAGSSRYAILKDGALSGGGFTYLDAYFGPLANHLDADMMAVPVCETTETGVCYGHICTEGVWFFDPDFQPTSGTYIMITYINNFAGLADDNFSILKRPSTSLTGADWSDGGGVRPASMQPGRILANGYALRDNLSSFSQFGIATDPLISLPVSWLSLTAKKSGKANLVEWVTASEKNNNYFTVERSTDALQFSPIGMLPALGNSSMQMNYSKTDETPPEGISYYRIRQTDVNGRSSYSKIVSLSRQGSDLELVNVFYNEEQGMLEVSLTCADQCVTNIELYDMRGTNVYVSSENAAMRNKILIPAFNLSKGVYLLKLSVGDQIITKKVIL
jgi:hypothetical protein